VVSSNERTRPRRLLLLLAPRLTSRPLLTVFALPGVAIPLLDAAPAAPVLVLVVVLMGVLGRSLLGGDWRLEVLLASLLLLVLLVLAWVWLVSLLVLKEGCFEAVDGKVDFDRRGVAMPRVGRGGVSLKR